MNNLNLHTIHTIHPINVPAPPSIAGCILRKFMR